MSIICKFFDTKTCYVDPIDINCPAHPNVSKNSGTLTMTWQADLPYNDLPPLPPARQQIETVPILKACITARAALAELKQAGQLLPNQTLLINLLPLLEAKDSSEIENIVTTMDKLFQFAHEDTAADAATKEALRYRTALYQGFKQLQQRPLSVTTATEICSTLKAQTMEVRKIPGTVIANQQTRRFANADRLRSVLVWQDHQDLSYPSQETKRCPDGCILLRVLVRAVTCDGHYK